jgi:hypothetical protein
MNGPDEDPDNVAAEGAAQAASSSVPQSQQTESGPDLQAQLLTLKRRIAGSRSLQRRLIQGISSPDEFHQRVVEIGAEHGVSLTPADSHAFLMQRSSLVGDAEVPDPPPASSQGHTCESTCTWNPYDHNCSYPQPAG